MPAKTPAGAGVFLWAEFLLLFGLGPVLILAWRRPGILFLVLWGGGLVCARLARGVGDAPRDLLVGPEVRRILRRFLLLGAALTAATWLIFPGLFLALPRLHTLFWALIMVLYPVLSVWPQEVIFRLFLRRRYAPIFGTGMGFIAASALAFGFAHVIFLNWIAVALTVAGGAMFAFDYARHRRLWLSCLEHSLYGCLVFTIGLGRFFYTGAAWHH